MSNNTNSNRRKIIAVVGDSNPPKDSGAQEAAYQVGKRVIEAGFRLCCGGMSGVMSAAMEGARTAGNYREGDTVGIIPKADHNAASPYADIVIATSIGHARNTIVANSDATIVVGGGAGTLSEVALAWTFNRLIIALPTTGGIAAKIAGTAIDHRTRGDIPALSMVWPAQTAEEAVSLLNKHLPDCVLKPHEFG